jgi:hypothetical protein
MDLNDNRYPSSGSGIEEASAPKRTSLITEMREGDVCPERDPELLLTRHLHKAWCFDLN